MRRLAAGILSVLLLAISWDADVQAQGKHKILASFKDSTDGAFDMSDWLVNKKGSLLLPTVITEPAVGYGIAGAVVFFHSSYSESKGPPSMRRGCLAPGRRTGAGWPARSTSGIRGRRAGLTSHGGQRVGQDVEPFAAAGYVTAMVNFHGSTVYGQAFTDSITGDWGGKPYPRMSSRPSATSTARIPS